MPPKSARILTNVTEAEINKEVAEAILVFAKNNTPFVNASVTVDAGKLKAIILSNVSTNIGRAINIFRSKTEA